MPSRIEDYAMIGDFLTCALVGRDGSVDWFCVPYFDSPACFAALLGKPEHGRWLIAPKGEVTATRRKYREGTLVLETEFETADGAVTVVDCMPPRERNPNLVRIVVGKRGRVPMRMELVVRYDYGSIAPWIRERERGVQAVAGPDSVLLDTGVPVTHKDLVVRADFEVAAGQRHPFTLEWHSSTDEVPEPADPEDVVCRTEEWWRKWSARCTYDGPWKETVVRSLITLKALTFNPSGGIVAAATTSLPEKLGGVRNWDYRYCWVRDATFTLYSLMSNGYTDEAKAWKEWLLRAVAGKPSDLNIMYGIRGKRRLSEYEVSWLPGYEKSAPVRVGNAAYKQFQLDVFGEVMDAMYQSGESGLLGEDAWNLQRALTEYLETAWKEPDEGIWEIRGPRQHFTHSKVMAWVAFDRMARSVRQFKFDGPAQRWEKIRDEIHRQVCEKGFDPSLNAFVQHYGSKSLDASLLMIPLVGFLPADDPRVVGTVEAIRRDLTKDGFVQRYPTENGVDGLPPGEGAFLACSFWLADNLTLMGRRGEAEALYERLRGLCNDVGLLSEEYDPDAKRLVGNFPQAFSHVGLVNSACNLSRKEGPAQTRRRR